MKSYSEQQRANIFRQLCERYDFVSRYESNAHKDEYGLYQWVIAAGSKELIYEKKADQQSWERLNDCLDKNKDSQFLPCLLSYDLKNSTEKLVSENPDYSQFPDLCIWKPDVLLALTRNGELIEVGQINEEETIAQKHATSFKKQNSLSEQEYTLQFNKLLAHIQRGDIYEVNYCREERGEIAELNPAKLFEELNSASRAPFSCIHKVKEHWLICSSPERFLNKRAEVLISQPIKGTIKRGVDESEDRNLQEQLKSDPKERAENIMIVDLVRNDLSKYASKGSVVVKELCGIYPFTTVSHMISTIEARLNNQLDGVKALAAAFPMGSMTGAPKYRAMELIEESEGFKRGIYSGATVYFNGNGDLDFNVVIRTIVWNEKTGHLSFSTGSAITAAAKAEKEFAECELKAKALWAALKKI